MDEKIFVTNSRGLKLASVINFPDKSKKHPGVIILHGFTGYKEEPHLEQLARFLAKNGFVAIRFDASGWGDSEGRLDKDYLMSTYLEDIKNVYNYFKNLNFVDGKKISICGHSMGGLLAIVFESEHPDLKSCIAISSPTTLTTANWIQGAVERWREVGWFAKIFSKNKQEIKIPYSFVQDADKYNALGFVRRLKIPFLTILGLSDDVVNPRDSREIFNAANFPKKLVEVEGAGHDYKNYPELIKIINEKILDFLKENS